MISNKTKKEQEIERLACNYFLHRNESCNTLTISNEERKIMSVVFEYIKLLYPKDYEEYGVEVVKSVKSTLNNYNFDKNSDYLHYLNRTLKLNIRHAKNKEINDEKMKGLHFSERDKNCELRLYKYYEIKNWEPYQIEKKIHSILSNKEYSKRIIEIHCLKNVIEDYRTDESNYSLIDNIPSPLIERNNLFEVENEIELLMDKIDNIYLKKKVARRKYLSQLYTIFLLRELCNFDDCKDFLSNNQKLYSLTFINKKILEKFIVYRELPKQVEIAESNGMKKSDASRELKSLIKKIN